MMVSTGRNVIALAPVQDTPIDPQQIQSAVKFPASLKDFAPEDAAAISDLRTRLGSAWTLGGLNDLPQYLNTELSNQFKLNEVAAGNSGCDKRDARCLEGRAQHAETSRHRGA
jgi:hypothetical protein